MITSSRLAGPALLAVWAAASVGCGGVKYEPVEGTITLNGKPLDNAQVQFLPDPLQGTKGLRSTGVSDPEGHFKLTCDDGQVGAVPGNHRVLVQDLKQWEGIRPGREDSNKPLKPSRLPTRYTDATQTPLKVEVKPAVGSVKLELTSP